MGIAATALLMIVEPLRQHQVHLVLGAGHGDVEQAALLLDIGGVAGGEIGGEAAIDHVEHVDGRPFLAFGGMDGGQGQVILIAQRRASLGAAGVGRVERQIGEELGPRRISGSNRRQLIEIGFVSPVRTYRTL